MHSTAKVYAHPRSPFWQAWFMIWDAKLQKWKPRTQSTKCTDEAKALTVARKLEQVAIKAAGASADARLSREYIVGAINSILDVSGQPIFEETHPWSEYADTWLESQKGRVRDGTWIIYKSHLRQLTKWLDGDAGISINTIDGDLLQRWYNEMIDEGRKPGTVNNTLKIISCVFDRARDEGFCPRNPADLVMKISGEKDVRDPFDLADIGKIIAHLKKSNQEEWLTVSLLGLCTGQRLQDCAQAKWSHFESLKKQRVWHVTQGKTGKKVTIPIVEPLASHLSLIEKTKVGTLLSPSLAQMPTGSINGLSSTFSRILGAAGVERIHRKKDKGSKGKGFTNKTYHSFRHTTNSLLANAGVNDDVRRMILGHASTEMNTRYTHLETSTTTAALEKAISDALA